MLNLACRHALAFPLTLHLLQVSYIDILALLQKYTKRSHCRYVANETPGTKQAKLQLLEQLGWKCYSVTWAERYTQAQPGLAALYNDCMMRSGLCDAV